MPHRAHPGPILLPHFPHPEPNANQVEGMRGCRDHGSLLWESPTGTGKTAVGFAYLAAHRTPGHGPLFYIAPTKAIVEQAQRMHPAMVAAYGRSEHACLFYPGQNLQADEVPCRLLRQCPHRVDQATGETYRDDGGTRTLTSVTPCPYLQQKYEAKQADIVACTDAFFLFTQVFSREWQQAEALVIDEAHRLADVVRTCLSYDITDHHLEQAIGLLERIDPVAADRLTHFRRKLISIVRSKATGEKTLLADADIEALLNLLRAIDIATLEANLASAVASGAIDPVAERETLHRLQTMTRNLSRYISSLEYCLPADGRHALDYAYAYWEAIEEDDPAAADRRRVRFRLTIKGHAVQALIAKRLLGAHTLAMTATVGDPQVFGYETGIKLPFVCSSSTFSADNTRLYLPTDACDLSFAMMPKRIEPKGTLTRIARACRRLVDGGQRCLVIVVSEKERQLFLRKALELGLRPMTYGSGISPREAPGRFKDGEGDVLVGTAAHYAEGVDLPDGIAAATFLLRPGYPSPHDPGAQFEERRFGGSIWPIRNWRVMIQALQARGRNVRSASDRGVTFLMSRQFSKFFPAQLPKWLQPAYRNRLTLDQTLADAELLLQARAAPPELVTTP